MAIGKRINNIIGKSGTVGAQLIKLRKRGKAAAPQVAALLRAPSSLNLTPPPQGRSASGAVRTALVASRVVAALIAQVKTCSDF